MFINKFIHEIKVWRTVRKVAKKNRDKLNEVFFDVDWVGRLYTVINLPEEIMELPVRNKKEQDTKYTMIDLYIKDKLQAVTEVLFDLQLVDLVTYPSNYEIFDGTNSVLIKLMPERIYTKFWRVFFYVLSWAALICGIIFGIKLLF